jgi:hypothetical protein
VAIGSPYVLFTVPRPATDAKACTRAEPSACYNNQSVYLRIEHPIDRRTANVQSLGFLKIQSRQNPLNQSGASASSALYCGYRDSPSTLVGRGFDAVFCELVSAGMAQHVGMRRCRSPPRPCSFDHARESTSRKRGKSYGSFLRSKLPAWTAATLFWH